ncbi:hypothetical protein [Streptomyces melanogenes]|uniref:hypothetical protein n=1 Tax=Streptomyces melanogenes TaxID=67326 RepID=UPI00167D60C3|nr:hypothetical protein [Streptomyces melanogenes]GGP88286.1 hypothetical protein GCM10010278_78520 [Streptomyces melanogenes]
MDFSGKPGFNERAGSGLDDENYSRLFGEDSGPMAYRDAHLRDGLPLLKDRTPGAFCVLCLGVDDFGSRVAMMAPHSPTEISRRSAL